MTQLRDFMLAPPGTKAAPTAAAHKAEPKPEPKAQPKRQPTEGRVHMYNWRTRHGQTEVKMKAFTL